jgi:WD40 repeat protein
MPCPIPTVALVSLYDGHAALLFWLSCHVCPGGRTVRQWEAHDKRIWAVDFCPLDASTYATGSDDGTVKVSSGHALADCADTVLLDWLLSPQHVAIWIA